MGQQEWRRIRRASIGFASRGIQRHPINFPFQSNPLPRKSYIQLLLMEDSALVIPIQGWFTLTGNCSGHTLSLTSEWAPLERCNRPCFSRKQQLGVS